MEVAMRDKDQYLVKAITAWKGDPNKRTSMKFWVQYDDGDEMWVSYKADLVDNETYQEFVAKDPRLFQLRFSSAIVHLQIEHMRRSPIVDVAPGDTVYVDLRYIKGHEAYDKLGLPNAYFTMYVCECSYVKWIGRTHHKIEAKCLVLDVLCRNWDSFDVYQFGSCKELLPTMTLVTEALCVQYPDILERHNRKKLLRMYNSRLPEGVAAVTEEGERVVL
jgi:hypothetical protein